MKQGSKPNSPAETRMQALVDGLLAYSRVTTHAKPFEWVDLNEVVVDLVSDLEILIDEAEATVVADDLPGVIGEPAQLRQLFQNLIANSIKFRSPDRPLRIQVTGHLDDNIAEVAIIDRGRGFDRGQAERIFKLFERLQGRSEVPGEGMGPAFAAKTVELHGGSVVASFAPDSEATFTVRLPAPQAGHRTSRPSAVSTDQTRAGQEIDTL